MEWKRFWKLTESAYRDDGAEHFEALKATLALMSEDELIAYQAQFDELMAAANVIDLWGAAYLINGGCSDDGFDYFRGWLLTRGREVFEAALANPDSLADVVDEEDVECEEMLYVAMHAYEEVTGEDFEGSGMDYSNLGDGWDFDDAKQMQRRYPRLWAKFGYD
jgi:hypothetical protein